MPSRFSAAWVDSILESREPDSKSSPSARPTPTDVGFSSDTGPTSPALRTYAMSLAGNDQQVEEEETPPFKASEAFGGQLISFSAAHPAKDSPSPASAECSPTTDPASSTNSPELPASLFGPEDGFYSRTYRDYSPAAPASGAETAGTFYDSIAEDGVRWAAAPDEMMAIVCLLTVRPSALMEPSVQGAVRVAAALRPDAFSMSTTAPSSRWSAASSATSGFTTSPGECWIAATSECPSDGDASSSLPDVLEADVHPRFSLSPKAAAGILRRAAKRGRELPQALAEALRALASQHPDDDKRTTRMSLDRSSLARQADGEETTTRLPAGSSRSSTPSDPTPDLAATPSAPSSVRRLTPTECERLQGFPDGWTWAPSTSEDETTEPRPSPMTLPVSEPPAAGQAEATSTETLSKQIAVPTTLSQTPPATQPAETPSPPTSLNGLPAGCTSASSTPRGSV